MKVVPIYDRSELVTRSIDTIRESLVEQMLQAIIKAAFEGPPYDIHLPIFIPGNSAGVKGR